MIERKSKSAFPCNAVQRNFWSLNFDVSGEWSSSNRPRHRCRCC